jgi:hypothetical protein
MTLPEGEIERIVRQVLARLTAAPQAAVNGHTPAEASATTLVLDARVVTLAELKGRLEKQQSVTVLTSAIVTPAVRDYLRERKVSLVRRQTTPQAAASGLRLAVGVTETRYDSHDLLRQLSAQGIQFEQMTGGNEAAVTDQVVECVKRDKHMGLVLTDQAAAAVCLANRQQEVRAAAAANVVGVDEAIRQIGVNLLVVNPRGQSSYLLRQMVNRYLSGAPHACPEALKPRL